MDRQRNERLRIHNDTWVSYMAACDPKLSESWSAGYELGWLGTGCKDLAIPEEDAPAYLAGWSQGRVDAKRRRSVLVGGEQREHEKVLHKGEVDMGEKQPKVGSEWVGRLGSSTGHRAKVRYVTVVNGVTFVTYELTRPVLNSWKTRMVSAELENFLYAYKEKDSF